MPVACHVAHNYGSYTMSNSGVKYLAEFFSLDRAEASQLIELPLARALYGPAYRFQRIERNGQTYRIYSIDHAGHHVWGATASMLVTLARASAALESRSFTIASEAKTG